MPEATNLATWFWCVNFLNSGTIPYRGEGVECAIIYSVFKHFKCQALKHAILCFLLYASSEYTAVEIRTHKSIKSKRDSTLPLSTATLISCTVIIMRIPSSAKDSEFVVQEKFCLLFGQALCLLFGQAIWRRAPLCLCLFSSGFLLHTGINGFWSTWLLGALFNFHEA